MSLTRDQLLPPILCSLALAALSTFGDWLWTHFIQDGAVVPGVLHGMVIFLALAALLARCANTRRAWKVLMPSLPVAGLLIAAGFYPIAMAVGYIGGLLATWVAMWLTLAFVQRIARGYVEAPIGALIRGSTAAVGSGLAFWSVSGMWTQAAPGGPNYLWHFACWTFAFLPGFLALLLAQEPAVPSHELTDP